MRAFSGSPERIISHKPLSSCPFDYYCSRLAQELLTIPRQRATLFDTRAQKGNGLKVEYVEPFVEAASAVLRQVSGGSVKSQPLGMLGTMFPAACVNIVSRVDGSLRGDVVYSMSSMTAQKLAGLLVGAEPYGFGRLLGSGLSQLGDMLARETGSILNNRGLDCNISGPTVFQGLNVEFSSATPALAVPLDTAAGRIDINVAVRSYE